MRCGFQANTLAEIEELLQIKVKTRKPIFCSFRLSHHNTCYWTIRSYCNLQIGIAWPLNWVIIRHHPAYKSRCGIISRLPSADWTVNLVVASQYFHGILPSTSCWEILISPSHTSYSEHCLRLLIPKAIAFRCWAGWVAWLEYLSTWSLLRSRLLGLEALRRLLLTGRSFDCPDLANWATSEEGRLLALEEELALLDDAVLS